MGSPRGRQGEHTVLKCYPFLAPTQALVVRNGGIRLLAEVLFGEHHNNEAAQRHALSALWNLAFDIEVRSLAGVFISTKCLNTYLIQSTGPPLSNFVLCFA